jgi:hypothetical protein
MKRIRPCRNSCGRDDVDHIVVWLAIICCLLALPGLLTFWE